LAFFFFFLLPNRLHVNTKTKKEHLV